MKIDLTHLFAAKGIDVMVSITIIGDSVVLAWGDVVPNEFEETYGSLSVALARLATLSFCGEGDDPWSECFKHDEDGWTSVAADWLETVVA